MDCISLDLESPFPREGVYSGRLQSSAVVVLQPMARDLCGGFFSARPLWCNRLLMASCYSIVM